MKKFFKSIKFIALCAMSAAVVLGGCNKDEEEEETLLTLDGSPYFYLPSYAMTGDTLELTASGVATKGATYEWIYGGLDSLYESDDLLTVKVVVPDSLATYQVTLSADAGDEYYSSSLVQLITSLNESSLTGVKEPQGHFTDPRDNRTYGFVTVGNLDWFAENLKWKGAGAGYGKTDAAGEIMGRLYTWNDATGGVSASGLGCGVQGVCPPGWSIPTQEDWVDLAMAVNGGVEVSFLDDWKGMAPLLMAPAELNGAVLWPYSPDVTPTNDYGWNAISAGTSNNNYNNYSNMYSYGMWWCSTEKDSNYAHFKYIYSEYPNVSVNYSSKDGIGVAVRCVRLSGAGTQEL
ncbi:MAG: hypothetical protein IJ383_08280 [Bacteroidales bacterium]|nr:hypothetical protein [Bacteroidales bacterium]